MTGTTKPGVWVNTTPAASDIDRVFEEGMKAAIDNKSATVANPYQEGTWQNAVFDNGLNSLLSVWIIDDLKAKYAASKRAADTLARLQSLLGEIMEQTP